MASEPSSSREVGKRISCASSAVISDTPLSLKPIETPRVALEYGLLGPGFMPADQGHRHVQPLLVTAAQRQHRPVAAPEHAFGSEAGEDMRHEGIEHTTVRARRRLGQQA